MADLRVTRDFFGHHLPPAVLATIDLNTLRISHNTYVDIALNESASDILYEVKIAEKPAYLYLLCEHQSSVDPLMPFRLWQYIVGIWSDHLKQSKKSEGSKSKKKKIEKSRKKLPLPLVIPMVFYHGPVPYTGPRHIRSLIEGSSELKEEGAMTIASRLIDMGLQQGVQQGLQQGVQQGIQQGQRRGEYLFLLSLLERKFGVIPTLYQDRIRQASSEQLLCWGAKLLEANSLEALFEEVQNPITL